MQFVGMRHIPHAHCVISTSEYVRVVTAGKSTIISMTLPPRFSPFLPHSHLAYLHFTICYMYICAIFPTHPHCSYAHTRPHTSLSVYMQLPITFCCLCAMFAGVFQEKRGKKRCHAYDVCVPFVSYIVFIVLNCFLVVSTHAHTCRYGLWGISDEDLTISESNIGHKKSG